MKITTFQRDAADQLTAVLRKVPFLESARFHRESTHGDSRADFVLAIRSRLTNRRLVCEVKSNGQPRIAREACLTLRDYVRSDERDYPVFIAPFISPAAAAVCDQYQVGYFDLAGNCRLAFDQVFIQREGFANPTVQKRDLRSLYSPKAERILRVLVTAAKRNWRMQDLADEAGVSLGQVANVKKLLSNREWIEADAGGIRLRSLESAVLPLLKEWAGNYRMERSTARDYYSLKPIPQMEAEMAEASRQFQLRYSLTGLSGAVRLAPTVRYQRITAYVLGDLPALADRLELRPVASGANVTILEPYDEGVFYGSRAIERVPVASPVQLYLDLMQIKGRGEEAATAIVDEVITPAWR
ncbi:MAG: type IV toxin-antitoxin system AbiEi family antitoxin [Paludibaculum sp.]